MKRIAALATGALAAAIAIAVATQLPNEQEIRERVLAPSVQVAVFEGIGGATSQWIVAGSGTVFKTPKGTFVLTAGHVVSRAIKYITRPPPARRRTKRRKNCCI
jgi:hypothetical protein